MEKEEARSFIAKYKKECYALNQWLNLNNKKFSFMDALGVIHDAVGGKPTFMVDVINKMTNKKQPMGRRGHVYTDVKSNLIDILPNEKGVLTLVGYNGKDSLPEPKLRGQRVDRNTEIFKGSDGQVRKRYAELERNFVEAGSVIRYLFPNMDSDGIAEIIETIWKYSQEKKINFMGVVSALKVGRLKVKQDGTGWKIERNVSESRSDIKRVIVRKDMLPLCEESSRKMTFYSFLSNVKSFIADLMNNPVTAKPSEELRVRNISRSRLIQLLLSQGVVRKDEKIKDKDDDGNPVTARMSVKYSLPKADDEGSNTSFLVPKKNFERKLRKLYIRLFEKNLPERNVNEEGGDGCTNAMSSGQFIQPMADVQRRTIGTKTDSLDEVTTTFNTGDYEYDCPALGDKETLARKNGKGGSISVQRKL